MARTNPEDTAVKGVRIMVVDDHALFRQGLKHILESEKDFKIVGEAADGEEAIRVAKALRPEVILMDLSMPNLSGIEATIKIKRVLPATNILLLSMHESPFLQSEGLKFGASGYILKRSVDRELFGAIRKVLAGQLYFPDATRQFRGEPHEQSSYESLSFREKEILRLLANGMTNKEIARHLCISVNTVETHRKNIMKKLNLHNLSEIIKYAMIYGIIQP